MPSPCDYNTISFTRLASGQSITEVGNRVVLTEKLQMCALNCKYSQNISSRHGEMSLTSLTNLPILVTIERFSRDNTAGAVSIVRLAQRGARGVKCSQRRVFNHKTRRLV